MDGTLVDSNGAHARAWADAFAEAGLDVPVERVRPLIGMGGDKLVPQATGRADASLVKSLGDRRTEIFFERYLDDVRPFPHVRELLERMKAEGFSLVVATSAKDDELEKLLEKAGIGDLLDDAATKDDARRSKPDPDIVGAALKRAGVRGGEALLLGDTPYDIAAARAAGVDTVAVCSGGWDPTGLSGALATYADAAALLDAWDDSPFARLARAVQAPEAPG